MKGAPSAGPLMDPKLQGLRADCRRVLVAWSKHMRAPGGALKPEREWNDVAKRIGMSPRIARRILDATGGYDD